MRTAHCSGRLSCHAHPLPHMPPATHVPLPCTPPCHACPPTTHVPGMHTPPCMPLCHACSLPCSPPWHAYPLCHVCHPATPPPTMPTPCHACPSLCRPPLPCTPPATHAPLSRTSPPVNRITDTFKNITFPQLRLRALISFWYSHLWVFPLWSSWCWWRGRGFHASDSRTQRPVLPRDEYSEGAGWSQGELKRQTKNMRY